MIHVAMQHQPVRVRALAEHLQKAVTDFRSREAKITDAEVAAALKLVAPAQGDKAREAALGIAITFGVLGLILGSGAILSKGTPPIGAWVLLAGCATVAVGGFLYVRLRD